MTETQERKAMLDGAITTMEIIEKKLIEEIEHFENPDGLWVQENQMAGIPIDATQGFIDGVKFTFNKIQELRQSAQATYPFERN
jgi:hypothetical protein